MKNLGLGIWSERQWNSPSRFLVFVLPTVHDCGKLGDFVFLDIGLRLKEFAGPNCPT